jgi:copper ion binding protein
MSCVNCARRIEQNLGMQPGIQSATVNFATGILTVEFDPEMRSVDGIIEQVENLGYRVRPADPRQDGLLRFSIRGMNCNACAQKIERTLASLSGVTAASVNLATAEARVEFDPSVISGETIYQTVTDLGYTPVRPESAVAPDDERTTPRNGFCESTRPRRALGQLPTERTRVPCARAATFFYNTLVFCLWRIRYSGYLPIS